jgi:hypothetical protein
LTESIHRDVAAFLANALEPDEDAAFADHLAGCETCRDELVWLSGVTLALAGEDADPVAAVPDPTDEPGPAEAGSAEPGPAEADQPVAQDKPVAQDEPVAQDGPAEPAGPRPPTDIETVRHRRAGRATGWLAAAAAAGLLVVGGGTGFLIGHSTAGVTAAPNAVQVLFDTGAVHRAQSPASRVTADIAVVPAAGGVDLGLRLSDPLGPKQCMLVAVGRNGARQTAMTWSVPAGGFGTASSGPLLARGQVGFHPGEIARFEIQSAGRTLLVIPD